MFERIVKSLLILAFIVGLALSAERFILPYLYLPKHKTTSASEVHDYEIIAEGLEVPWDLVFLPDDGILVSERKGNIVWLSESRKHLPFSAYHIGEGGLQGMVLHPRFTENGWIYLYSTQRKSGRVFNRVERFRFDRGRLTDPRLIVENIPGAKYHDGGRMAFGPDGYLYITTGDAGQEMLAQDIHSLAGKILRLTEDGSFPKDNPFNNPVYSYGHRNSQGLAWDDQNRLWSTEHGPSGFESGHDELNLIEKGKNYGWPLIRGMQTQQGMEVPVVESGADETWAPAAALYWDGSIFFTGLRGEALYEAVINQGNVFLKEHFKGRFGRLRALVLGPDGYFYLTTSNRDDRGFPKKGDDKIVRINPQLFRTESLNPPSAITHKQRNQE